MLQDLMVWFENSLAGPAHAAWWSQTKCPTNLCQSCRKKMWWRCTTPPVAGSPTWNRQRYASSCAVVWHSASGKSGGRYTQGKLLLYFLLKQKWPIMKNGLFSFCQANFAKFKKLQLAHSRWAGLFHVTVLKPAVWIMGAFIYHKSSWLSQ